MKSLRDGWYVAESDDFADGPDAVDREQLDLAVELLRDIGDSTFNITAPNGRLLATRFPQYCGLQLTADRFLPLLVPVFGGQSNFIRPFRDVDRVADSRR